MIVWVKHGCTSVGEEVEEIGRTRGNKHRKTTRTVSSIEFVEDKGLLNSISYVKSLDPTQLYERDISIDHKSSRL